MFFTIGISLALIGSILAQFSKPYTLLDRIAGGSFLLGMSFIMGSIFVFLSNVLP